MQCQKYSAPCYMETEVILDWRSEKRSDLMEKRIIREFYISVYCISSKLKSNC